MSLQLVAPSCSRVMQTVEASPTAALILKLVVTALKWKTNIKKWGLHYFHVVSIK